MKRISLIVMMLTIVLSSHAQLPYWKYLKTLKEDMIKAKLEKRDKSKVGKSKKNFSSRKVGRGNITCNVYDTSGSVINRKSFEVYDEYGFSFGRSYADSGKLVFADIFPGKYTIGAEEWAYSEFEHFFLGDTKDPSLARFVDVSNGMTTDAGTIIYDPSVFDVGPKDSVNISGFIKSVDNDTLGVKATFTLTFKKIDTEGELIWANRISVDSEEDGTFSKKISLGSGEYFALVHNINYQNKVAMPIWIKGEDLLQAPASIIVNDSIKDLELYVKEGGEIHVSALDEVKDSLIDDVSIYCINENGLEMNDFYVYEHRDTGTFRGLPEGNYYLKTDRSKVYKDHWYFPGTFDIKSAQKISVTSGATSNVNFTLNSRRNLRANEASIKTIVRYPDGSILPDWDVTIDYVNRDDITEFSYIDTSDIITIESGEPIRIYVSSSENTQEKLFLSRVYSNNTSNPLEAEIITLNSGEMLNLEFDFEWGGSVAGFITDKNGKKVDGKYGEYGKWIEGVDYEWSIGNIATAYDPNKKITYDSRMIGYPFLGGYRLNAILDSTCNISTIPIFLGWEDRKNALNISPSDIAGIGSLIENEINIIDTNTTVVNITASTEASAIIKGYYPIPTDMNLEDGILFYAVNSDGLVQSMSYTDSEILPQNADTSVLSDFYNQDYETLLQLTSGSHTKENVFVIPQLYKGEYYIAAGMWDAVTEDYYIHWYGIDTIIVAKEYDQYIENGGFLTIPNGAKMINVDSDNSIINVEFGNTPISNKTKFSNQLLSKFNIHKNKIQFSYNLSSIKAKNLKAKLLSISGKTIWKNSYTKRTGNITLDADKESFANGIYILKLKAGDKSFVKQVNLIK